MQLSTSIITYRARVGLLSTTLFPVVCVGTKPSGPLRRRRLVVIIAVSTVIVLAIALGIGLGVGLHKKGSSSNDGSASGVDSYCICGGTDIVYAGNPSNLAYEWPHSPGEHCDGGYSVKICPSNCPDCCDPSSIIDNPECCPAHTTAYPNCFTYTGQV